MTPTLHLKLRGIFFSNNSPDPLTNPLGAFFSNILSALTNFSRCLTTLFNQQLPPETRDQQIHCLRDGATPYLVLAVVVLTWLCCWCCVLPCISSVLIGIFNGVWSCLRWCLCCGRGSERRMMKAPGRPWRRLPRDAFEANPRGYFRSLRGQSSNFCY